MIWQQPKINCTIRFSGHTHIKFVPVWTQGTQIFCPSVPLESDCLPTIVARTTCAIELNIKVLFVDG